MDIRYTASMSLKLRHWILRWSWLWCWWSSAFFL